MSEPPFEVGERVQHCGTGLEAVFIPGLKAQGGTVVELRTAYKRSDKWVAHVLFDGQDADVPIECDNLTPERVSSS